MHAISTTGLTKRYGNRTACDSVSLDVDRGEIFGLLGPNGAGKSTFVKMLVDLARPTGGSASVFGCRAGTKEAKRRLSFLPEGFRFHRWLTGEEVLRLQASLNGIPKARRPARFAEVLAMVRLTGSERYQVGSYSKGMQQRLGIACALLPEPEVVFLDEPTSALDPIGRREVRGILVELRNRGTTVFLNSHLLSEVEMVCDRVAFMREARVVAVGALSEFLRPDVEVEVAMERRTPEVAAVLDRFGEQRWENGTASVRLERADTIPDLTAALVHAGARIHRVAPHSRSLEDVFVDIMEGREP